MDAGEVVKKAVSEPGFWQGDGIHRCRVVYDKQNELFVVGPGPRAAYSELIECASEGWARTFLSGEWDKEDSRGA